jgi:hypothetical protein
LVGEEITLGSGTLFTETDPDTGLPTAVGLAPDDGRDEDWFDPRALYRCHDQTVRLELRAACDVEYRGSDDAPRCLTTCSARARGRDPADQRLRPAGIRPIPVRLNPHLANRSLP